MTERSSTPPQRVMYTSNGKVEGGSATPSKEEIIALDLQLKAVNFDRRTLAIDELVRAWPAIRDLAISAVSETATPMLTCYRLDALEEAAKIADHGADGEDPHCCLPVANGIAASIRALKNAAPQEIAAPERSGSVGGVPAESASISGGYGVRGVPVEAAVMEVYPAEPDARCVAAAKDVITPGFDEELFDLCRNDDYAGIHAVIEKRLGERPEKK